MPTISLGYIDFAFFVLLLLADVIAFKIATVKFSDIAPILKNNRKASIVPTLGVTTYLGLVAICKYQLLPEFVLFYASPLLFIVVAMHAYISVTKKALEVDHALSDLNSMWELLAFSFRGSTTSIPQSFDNLALNLKSRLAYLNLTINENFPVILNLENRSAQLVLSLKETGSSYKVETNMPRGTSIESCTMAANYLKDLENPSSEGFVTANKFI